MCVLFSRVSRVSSVAHAFKLLYWLLPDKPHDELSCTGIVRVVVHRRFLYTTTTPLHTFYIEQPQPTVPCIMAIGLSY